MKKQKNPVFITYFNPVGIYNFQGIRLDTIGVATVLKENGKVSHGLSIKSSLDEMNRKKGSDMAIGRAFSNKPCIEYEPTDEAGEEAALRLVKEKSVLKLFHWKFVDAVKEDPERFIFLQAEAKKKQLTLQNGTLQTA